MPGDATIVGRPEQPCFVLVSGIPRAGTNWIVRIVRSVLEAVGQSQEGGVAEPGGRRDDYPTNARGDAEDLRLRQALAEFRRAGRGVCAAKTHYYPGSALTADERFRVVWQWRDLRDVMASTCHYARSGPAADHFGALPEDEAFDQIIRRTLPPALAALRHVADVGVPPTTLVWSYERTLDDTPAAVAAVARHLGAPLAQPQAARIAAAHSFERESGRAPGQEDRSSYHRMGTVGSWRRALPARHQELVAELAPDLAALQAALRERFA